MNSTFTRSIEWSLGRHVGNDVYHMGPWAVVLVLLFIFLSRRRRG